ncbi:MAG: hypothetical protein RBU45_23220 [Myxococcota bacterium]|jgi:hypothetical protein|nr:hypothetical protein [Myxococcota bacterium]
MALTARSLLCLLVLGSLPLVGCKKTPPPPPAIVDAGPPELPPAEPEEVRPSLSSEQQARMDALQEGHPLLPLELATALIGAPSAWALDIVKKVYPRATVSEDNPRVNLLLQLDSSAAPVSLADVRWKATDRKVIGSVVFSYAAEADREAIKTAIGAVGKPVEGDLRDWLVEETGVRISFYPEGYEGGARVSFEPKELEGAAITHEEDAMKEVKPWEVAKPRDSRPPEEAPDPRLAPPEGAGKKPGKN